MKKFFKDFKAFITKGNIIDLAVAVVIGGAFSKIVTSLVNDIIMPLISLATGGSNVSDLKWIIQDAVIVDGVVQAGETALRYGMFLQTVIDFLIIALCIFSAIRLAMYAKANFENSANKTMEKINKKLAKKNKKSAIELETIETKSDSDVAVVTETKTEIVNEPVDTPPSLESLLIEIRDLLKK